MNEQQDKQDLENIENQKPNAVSGKRNTRLYIPPRFRAFAVVMTFAIIGLATLAITLAYSPGDTNRPNFSAEGELKRYVIEDFAKDSKDSHDQHKNYKEEFYLKTSTGERLKLVLPEKAQQQLIGGSKIRINGNKTGETVTLPQNYEAYVQVLAAPEAGTDLTADSTTAPATTTRKVAVILFNFSDDKTQPITTEAARQAIFSDPNYPTTNSFYKRNSYNQVGLSGLTNVDGDVFGYYTINATKSGNCDYSSWGTLADQAAQAAGTDLSAYNHIVYAFPSASCPFSGIAELPGKRVWLSGVVKDSLVSHELGHNLGLYHANGFVCKDSRGLKVSISDSCSSQEYADSFDTMGEGDNSDFNGHYRSRVGWLASTNVQTVTASGDYTLNALEATGPEVKVLRVPRYAAYSGQLYFQLEYRQRNGGGVLVRQVSDAAFNPHSNLIDTTDETTFFQPFIDAPLAIGRTLADTTNKVTITPISTTSTSVKVRVTIEAPTTTTKGRGGKKPAPTTTTTTATPDNAQYVSTTAPVAVKPDGQLFSASITMKNTGTTTWLASDYKLAAIVVPANKWGLTELNLTRDVAPGATATFTGTFTSPETTTFQTPQSFSWRMVKKSTNNWFGSPFIESITVSYDLTAPAAPTNLQTTATNTNSVSLSWAPASMNSTMSFVAGYQVYRVNSTGAVSLVGNTAYSTVFTDTGLSPGTSYNYYVVAMSANGLESPQSAVLKATTLR